MRIIVVWKNLISWRWFRLAPLKDVFGPSLSLSLAKWTGRKGIVVRLGKTTVCYYCMYYDCCTTDSLFDRAAGRFNSLWLSTIWQLLTIPCIPSHFLGCVWNKDAVLLVTEIKSPRRRREQEVIQLYCSGAVWSDLGCTAAQTSLCIYYSRWHLAFCLKQQSQISIGPLDREWLRFIRLLWKTSSTVTQLMFEMLTAATNGCLLSKLRPHCSPQQVEGKLKN